MALFFPNELATTVDAQGGEVLIIQYTDNTCDEEVGRVILTRHQFDEMFNRSKRLFDGEE